MTSDEIKKIIQINEEISELISNLEKKQRKITNELINLVLEKDKRIEKLEQKLAQLEGKPIPQISSTVSKTTPSTTPETAKIDLTDALSELGLSSEPSTASKAKSELVKGSKYKLTNIKSSEKKETVSIFNDTKIEDKKTAGVEKTATISRYGGVAVLKRPSGSSKFRPRSQPPPPKPKSKPQIKKPPPKKQNKDALLILENLKSQISEETTTHELYKILENVRDELANIIGFSAVIRDIGTVSTKLKHAPDLALDESSISAFIKKVESWKSNI
ncbi:MAG: hypothetical protein ACTSR3_10910 [Candidatus Helarchaeota archaeon]